MQSFPYSETHHKLSDLFYFFKNVSFTITTTMITIYVKKDSERAENSRGIVNNNNV